MERETTGKPSTLVTAYIFHVYIIW